MSMWLFLFIVLVIFTLVNTPLIALSYKFQRGYEPMPYSTRDFWIYAQLTGTGLACMLAVSLLLLSGLVYIGVPVWIACSMVFIIYTILCVTAFMWIYDLALPQGLTMFVAFHFLPTVVICVLALFSSPLLGFMRRQILP